MHYYDMRTGILPGHENPPPQHMVTKAQSFFGWKQSSQMLLMDSLFIPIAVRLQYSKATTDDQVT